MNNLEQQLNKLSEIKLDAKSKADIRFKLNNLINEPLTSLNTESLTSKPSPFDWFFLESNHKLIGALGVFIFTFGIAYGAEFSYPNNILYPIKTNINEPLLSILKTTPQTKLDWQFELTKRRLKEATHLATNNNLTPDIENALSIKLATHIQNYKNINKSPASDPEVTITKDEQVFESTLIEDDTSNTLITAEDLPESAPQVALETKDDEINLMMALPKEEPQSLKDINASTSEDTKPDRSLKPKKTSDITPPNSNVSNLIETLEFYKQEIVQKSNKKNSPLVKVIDERLKDLKK